MNVSLEIQILPKRWIITLVLYWLFSMGGASLIGKTDPGNSAETGWIIVCAMTLILLPVFTDRIWTWKGKLLWILALWPATLLSYGTFGLAAIYLCGLAGRAYLADRAAYFFAHLPLVVFAMWRSKIFTNYSSKKDDRKDS